MKTRNGTGRKAPIRPENFPATPAEQEARLREHPMLRRFSESRRALAGDRHRPLYHFVSPESDMNDPNGLCYWQGRWHLFYQGYPPENRCVHWGHAVSNDLVHWRDLPYAIGPDVEKQCYSGTTLVEKDRVIAMYHGKELGNMVAVSRDPLLLDWEKLTGTAVIPNGEADKSTAFDNIFDPCIWKRGKTYYSLSGHSDRGAGKRRVNVLFRSNDLVRWECLHEFVENDFYTLVGDDGACPYFWPIGDRHILLFFSHMSGGQYLLGDYDTGGDKFVVTHGGKFNFGPARPSGVHAPSATPDGKGGVIVIFNMNPGKPTAGWNQIMTLPRRLTIDNETPLHPMRVEPAGDIASLRERHYQAGRMTIPANRDTVLDGIAGNTLEIEAVIEPDDGPSVELDVLRSPDGAERTRIVFYRNRGYRRAGESLVSIDSSCASESPDVLPRAPETAPVFLADGEPLALRVFVDRSVVEVFVNGRQCIAVRVYPGRDDSVGVAFRARGRDAQLRSLDAWSLRTIYET